MKPPMRIRKRLAATTAAAVGAIALFGLQSATATALSGPFAPFDRCPVDSAAMLESAAGKDGCVAAESPHGTFKIGNTTTTTGNTNLQVGLSCSDTSCDASGSEGTKPFALVSGTGGSIVADPAEVPGGLIGLMCPSEIPLVSALCKQATEGELNRVTATVEGAGTPSNFNLSGTFLTGIPLLTLPVKLHLSNPLLGSSCYIGSNAEPIVLHPESTDLSGEQLKFETTDLDGTPDKKLGPLNFVTVSNTTQGDDSFAVPGANGCGPLGIASVAIDLKVGLPSPSGKNSVVLNEATSHLVSYSGKGTPPTGAEFAKAFHDAGLP